MYNISYVIENQMRVVSLNKKLISKTVGILIALGATSIHIVKEL